MSQPVKVNAASLGLNTQLAPYRFIDMLQEMEGEEGSGTSIIEPR